MANPALMRQLFQHMLFTQAASNALTDKQGLNSLGEMRLLTNDDYYTLCKTIKHPGRTIINAAGDTVSNPGHSVSLVAEKNLKLAVFNLNHQQCCSKTADYADVTLPHVRTLKSLYHLEQSYKKPDDPDPTKITNAETQANYHEKRLQTNQYHGQKCRYNFYKYTTEMLDSIQLLNNLMPFGYSGVDQGSAI